MLLHRMFCWRAKKRRAILHVLTDKERVIIALPSGEIVSLTLFQVGELRELLRDAVVTVDSWLRAVEKRRTRDRR